MDNTQDTHKLLPQNFTVAVVIAIAAFVVLLASQMDYFSSSLLASSITLVVNRLLLAAVIWSWGRYLRNFTKPYISHCACLLIVVLLVHTFSELIISIVKPDAEWVVASIYVSAESLQAALIMILGLTSLRAHDYIGGLKTIGCIFIAKAVVTLAIVILYTAIMTDTHSETDGESTIGMLWGIANHIIFLITLVFYFASYKIFRGAGEYAKEQAH